CSSESFSNCSKTLNAEDSIENVSLRLDVRFVLHWRMNQPTQAIENETTALIIFSGVIGLIRLFCF
ncbi:hypothetical protein, partial [Vibrio parahaemolyticus]|uniref:hypothetical protein n=1 Tax=Vibrio parahaemolyticus TaxID=670 RepID=UPI001C5DF715